MHKYKEHTEIAEDDVRHWSDRFMAEWFAQVLRGEYNLDEAREDCLSIINSPIYGDKTKPRFR